MKKLKVTVNGRAYDVVVEEVEESNESNTVRRENDCKFKTENRTENRVENKTKNNMGEERGKAIKSPMPGTVVSVKVEIGKRVSKGEVLVILEAMKMENEIVAPFDAEVTGVKVKSGDSVDSGADLVFLG